MAQGDLGEQIRMMAQAVHSAALASPGVRIGSAESCTGGHIAASIVDFPGSSAYFMGGIVSYSNDAKRDLLGVPADVLENPGAVSEQCARAMAEGVRRVLGVDIAIATTGIAGPSGGTGRKPTGLVYLALATPEGTVVRERKYTGDRAAVIDSATRDALSMLHAAIAGRSEPGLSMDE